MTFNIGLQRFRTFEATGLIPIRPITLLTGGNSAGKSSFLAALRYLSDVSEVVSTGSSFNKDPFFLGAYEQIAHHRGGRYGRTNEFTLSYAGPMGSDRYPRMASRRELPSEVRVDLKFQQLLSQPAIRSISYESSLSGLHFEYNDDWSRASIRAWIRDSKFETDIIASQILSAQQITSNPSLLYLFIDTVFSEIEDRNLFRQRFSDLNEISNHYRLAVSAVPSTSFVGAPVRSAPARTYNPLDTAPHAEGSHVPSKLAQLARTRPETWNTIRSSISEFGTESALFKNIEIRSLGRNDSDPFQIYVTINGPRRNIVDVGYGVSQSLPVIFEMVTRPKDSIHMMQQPEVHLHPEAQAALGSFIARESKRVPGYIAVETHSDYLIDRVRRHIRNGDLSPSDVSLLYFERKKIDAKIFEIGLDKSGTIVSAPDSYRDFFIREEFANLGFPDVSSDRH